jgi:hypothetical protein
MTDSERTRSLMDQTFLGKVLPGREGILWEGGVESLETLFALHVRVKSVRFDDASVDLSFDVLPSRGFVGPETLCDISTKWEDLSIWEHSISKKNSQHAFWKLILNPKVVKDIVDTANNLDSSGASSDKLIEFYNSTIVAFRKKYALFDLIEDPTVQVDFIPTKRTLLLRVVEALASLLGRRKQP